ncbi:MAG: AAA family ATPase [Magnetococcales bacterium]|nr:AAA family ATPase [Magnetococcales bacterium]
MITKVHLENFGPLRNIEWGQLGNINLIIGRNGTGKTFLLKALYCAIRSVEAFGRGNDNRRLEEILADKLYWTFQPEKIGDLVSKDGDGRLSCDMDLDNKHLFYEFGRSTEKSLKKIPTNIQPGKRPANSIFLPAKEVLSLHGIILRTRRPDHQEFGFDDTYFDLANVLTDLPSGGKNFQEFKNSRKQLEEIIGGKLEFDEKRNRWLFKKGRSKFPIGLTAEGIKKIAILDILLGNRYLTPESVIFIDEPESALHPEAVSKFLDIITLLAKRGVQIFMASHSYFVVKKLYLIAQKERLSIPLLHEADGAWHQSDLKDGLPDNSIIDESVRLYEEAIDLALL